MTTLRVKDSKSAMDRVDTFVDAVRDSSERRARFRDHLANGNAERILEEALDLIDLQHAELLAAEQELRDQVDELARTLGVVQVERERYQQLFDAAPDAYFVTDANGIIREANEQAAELLAVQPRFICGKPLAMYVSSTTTASLRESLSEANETSSDVRVEIVGRKGAPVHVRMRARRFDHGRVLWTAREEEGPLPTEIGDLARTMRDKNDLLERERRDRERLERESRAKDRFLAILSHDLRAPLNAVLGWADLLRREVLDQGRRERALMTIDRNARAMLGLVEELLDISRITADRMQLDVRPLDVTALVLRVVEATHPVAREKGIVLGCTTEAGVVVVADAKRIEQCVTNLLSNALRFTPVGGGIDVTVRREGDHALISVRDNGRGIRTELLPHVFECFRQGGDADGPKGDLGLGLFIVRQIARLHGGTAHAMSEGEGRGATFSIEIPLAERGPRAAESAAALVATPDLEGVRVLVIDDDEDTRELITTLLGAAGAHVASAADKVQATNLIETWSPDAIVSDMSMQTHEDGLAVVRAARDRLGDDVVVVALTGFASERDAARSLAAGFDAHLAKPLASGELIATLARLRDARSGNPEHDAR